MSPKTKNRTYLKQSSALAARRSSSPKEVNVLCIEETRCIPSPPHSEFGFIVLITSQKVSFRVFREPFCEAVTPSVFASSYAVTSRRDSHIRRSESAPRHRRGPHPSSRLTGASCLMDSQKVHSFTILNGVTAICNIIPCDYPVFTDFSEWSLRFPGIWNPDHESMSIVSLAASSRMPV